MNSNCALFAKRTTTAAALAASLAVSSLAAASEGRPVSVAERIQGAHTVVVATAASVNATWRENAFGDRLIVSRVVLHVEETLKGARTPTVSMDLEGGTLDGFTLRVSTLPVLAPGERAVFFLEEAGGGVYRSHLRGLGILKLDDQDQVKGSSLRLDDIRRVAATSVK